MIRKTLRSLSLFIALIASIVIFQQTALAGPPLICQTIEIGNAKSLPWGAASDWRAVKQDYDLNRLVEETLALLTPETPPLVRMETLRRATIYAMWSKYDREVGYKVTNEKTADELLNRLMDRVRSNVRTNQSPSLSLFDAGYLTSCYQQASRHSGKEAGKKVEGYAMVKKALDGYSMVRKASGFGGGSAEMEFAAALISKDPPQPSYRDHLQKAIAGAKDGTLLAQNLVKHFGRRGQNLADLRAQVRN